jgi:lysophospholipase L1-like esterase
MKNKTKNYLVLISTIFLIIAVDRLLLFYFGLPLWEWDEKLHYKHRINIVRYWERNKKPIKINEYGQHDDSFPVKKKKKELRILNLGDSITMGHEVTKDETYSKYLEVILHDSLKNYEIIQAINAGVQGYSTFQELEVLKRDLIFQPDIVTIGFCLNDVTEPFAVNKNFGGTGLDYHKVTQATNGTLSYLVNETGFGRLIQEIRISKLDAKQEKLAELFDVQKMLLHKDDPMYQARWKFTLKKLTEIYSLCKSRNIRIILLVFPYTFQFEDLNLSWTQAMLIKNAKENDIDYIDFLEVFKKEMNSNQNNLKHYYLDEDHFTPQGHQLVARELSNRIVQMNNF